MGDLCGLTLRVLFVTTQRTAAYDTTARAWPILHWHQLINDSEFEHKIFTLSALTARRHNMEASMKETTPHGVETLEFDDDNLRGEELLFFLLFFSHTCRSNLKT